MRVGAKKYNFFVIISHYIAEQSLTLKIGDMLMTINIFLRHLCSQTLYNFGSGLAHSFHQIQPIYYIFHSFFFHANRLIHGVIAVDFEFCNYFYWSGQYNSYYSI